MGESWRPDDFQFLRDAAIWAQSHVPWVRYGAYCTLREQGHRRRSLSVLRKFLTETEQWTREARREFCDGLLSLGQTLDAQSMAYPQPMVKGLLIPVFEDWRDADPQASVPRRWLARLTHDSTEARAALALDPSDDIARCLLIQQIDGCLGYELHELPWGYLGDDLKESLEGANEGLRLLDELRVDWDVQENRKRFQFYRDLLESYLAYLASGSDVAFLEWARVHGRVTGLKWER